MFDLLLTSFYSFVATVPDAPTASSALAVTPVTAEPLTMPKRMRFDEWADDVALETQEEVARYLSMGLVTRDEDLLQW